MIKFLEKILHFGLYAVPFTALIIIPGTFFCFIFDRTLILQILIEALAAAWLILSVKRPDADDTGRSASGASERPVKIKKSAVFYAVIAFWAVNFLATIFSANTHVSFWGKAMRMDGFLFLSHLLLWFLILVSEFKTEREWLKFFKVTAVLAGAISLVGLMQYYFSVWPGFIYQSGRVFSFFGNSTYFANYSVFFIFLPLFLISRSVILRSKLFWLAILLLNLAAFYYSKTRGAMIGLLAGLVVLAVVLLFLERRRKKIKIIGITILGLVVAAVIFSVFAPRFINLAEYPTLNRFTSITRESFTSRFIGADIAWKGILERPVLGWGPANFDLIFDKYYNPESLKLSFAETAWDKPHNYLLEMGTGAGFLGVAAYLAVYAAAIFVIFKSKKNKIIDGAASAIFLGLLAAKFVSVLSSFETPDTLIILFAFFAYLNSLPDNVETHNYASLPITASKEIKTTKMPATLPLILIFVAGYFVVINFKNISGSRAIARANNALYIDQIEWRENVLKFLDEKSPYKDDMVNLAAIDLAAWEGKESSIGEMLQPVLRPLTEYLADAEKRNGRAYIYSFQLAQVLGMRGDYLSEKDAYNKALEALDRAIKISPTRQSIYLVKGKIYLTRGDGEKAIAVLREAVNLYPEAIDPHWFLGLALIGGGDFRGGLAELERGKSAGTLKPNEAFYLISLYNQEKMYEKIVPIYRILIERYPENAAELWASLAATYLELKDKDRASEAASHALLIDPSLRAGIGEFMKRLERLP